jgi:hypothetical protein
MVGKVELSGHLHNRFDHVRIPRENLLNSVADVTPDGQYESAIKDPDQRFGAFMAPLTSGRVTIAVSAVYQAKVLCATLCPKCLNLPSSKIQSSKKFCSSGWFRVHNFFSSSFWVFSTRRLWQVATCVYIHRPLSRQGLVAKLL